MPNASKLKVMISSRCNVPFSDADPTSLTEIRTNLIPLIEGMGYGERTLFDVWINEKEPPRGGSWTSEEVCLDAVRESDILLILYNGHSGWVSESGTIGICHAEVKQGLTSGASKVHLIQLPLNVDENQEQCARDAHFGSYLNRYNMFRGTKVSTVQDLELQIQNTLMKALVELARGGVREAKRGRGDAGEALDWNRLDFGRRSQAIQQSLMDSATDVGGVSSSDNTFTLEMAGDDVLFVVGAIPAALTVSSAREVVGQPFLQDHHYADKLDGIGGPVHLIGCHKNATEAQAIRMLGFPDATVLTTPFGIYVADQVQKIQFVLLTYCQDETNCRHRFQSLLEWLKRSEEDVQIRNRAMSRSSIIKAIFAEMH